MADNLNAPLPSGTTLATDEIAGVHYPRTKISVGTDGSAVDVSSANPMPVVQVGVATSAGQDATRVEMQAIQGVEAIVVGTDGTPRRGILVVCTTAGDVRLKFADNSLLTVPVSVGLTVLPFSVKTVVTSGTTAVANYWSTL